MKPPPGPGHTDSPPPPLPLPSGLFPTEPAKQALPSWCTERTHGPRTAQQTPPARSYCADRHTVHPDSLLPPHCLSPRHTWNCVISYITFGTLLKWTRVGRSPGVRTLTPKCWPHFWVQMKGHTTRWQVAFLVAPKGQKVQLRTREEPGAPG